MLLTLLTLLLLLLTECRARQRQRDTHTHTQTDSHTERRNKIRRRQPRCDVAGLDALLFGVDAFPPALVRVVGNVRARIRGSDKQTGKTVSVGQTDRSGLSRSFWNKGKGKRLQSSLRKFGSFHQKLHGFRDESIVTTIWTNHYEL